MRQAGERSSQNPSQEAARKASITPMPRQSTGQARSQRPAARACATSRSSRACTAVSVVLGGSLLTRVVVPSPFGFTAEGPTPQEASLAERRPACTVSLG